MSDRPRYVERFYGEPKGQPLTFPPEMEAIYQKGVAERAEAEKRVVTDLLVFLNNMKENGATTFHFKNMEKWAGEAKYAKLYKLLQNTRYQLNTNATFLFEWLTLYAQQKNLRLRGSITSTEPITLG